MSGIKLLAKAGFDRIALALDIGVDMFAALASRDRRRNDMVVRETGTNCTSIAIFLSGGQQVYTNSTQTGRMRYNETKCGNGIDQALSGYKVKIDKSDRKEFE